MWSQLVSQSVGQGRTVFTDKENLRYQQVSRLSFYILIRVGDVSVSKPTHYKVPGAGCSEEKGEREEKASPAFYTSGSPADCETVCLSLSGQ